MFCGFRPLKRRDFASQNHPQFHKERKLSLLRERAFAYTKAVVIKMKKEKSKARLKRVSEKKPRRMSLTLLFSLVVFIILLVAIGLAVLAVHILMWTGVIRSVDDDIDITYIALIMFAVSIFIGSVIVFFSSRIPLKPINNMINKMNSLAAGDFKARLEFGGALGYHPAIREITDSFNKMAAELQNTEMLRSDFVNNFSHEFKTPIVSIAGIAKLLKRGNISEEEKAKYLDAIEEESMRLSYMATNVLNLTKVENQTILTDLSSFNLSEQIRSAVLLLESKWSRKQIDLQLDFEEYTIEANEELLKQVWINLFDNAVKFAPVGGMVTLEISERADGYSVLVSNTESEIPKDKMDKIFNKFYQCDESHASEGNGIGLAIVKRIVDLHGGKINVTSEGGVTAFSVELPKAQSVA